MTRRTVFYLFWLAADEPVPVARFTDRADAVRAAWAFEGLGWHAEVRRREEGGADDDGPWAHEYRSRVRPRRAKAAAAGTARKRGRRAGAA